MTEIIPQPIYQQVSDVSVCDPLWSVSEIYYEGGYYYINLYYNGILKRSHIYFDESKTIDIDTLRIVTDNFGGYKAYCIAYIPPDPCEGIICPDYCDDINHIKYTNGYCVNGECVYDTIEQNSVECGYISSEIELPIDEKPIDEEPEEEPEEDNMTKIYGLLVGIGLGAILLFRK